MGCFEDVVNAYAQKSVDFVETNEPLFYRVLCEFYSRQDEDFFKANLRFSKAEFKEKGIETLVAEGKHLPVAEFYSGIAEKLKEQILSDSQGSNNYVNAFFGVFFGFRMDIERTELEREFEANKDLSDKKMVEYLLKLRGLFGGRAFITYRGPSMDLFNLKAIERYILLNVISSYTIFLLKQHEEIEERRRKNGVQNGYEDGLPDFDAGIDF